MGVFDNVITPCPRCETELSFQSKRLDATCLDYGIDDAPADVIGCTGVEQCDGCSAFFTLEPRGGPFGGELHPLGACRVFVSDDESKFPYSEAFHGEIGACVQWIEDHDPVRFHILEDLRDRDVRYTSTAQKARHAQYDRQADIRRARKRARELRKAQERDARLAACGVDLDRPSVSTCVRHCPP